MFAIVVLAAVGLGTIGSAYEAHEQGQAIKAADERKARVEADNARQKQIDMRQNMLRALASQNAGTLGAVGTGTSTGFGANAMRQINQNQNDLLISRANSSAEVSLLEQAGSNAAAAGNIEAGVDVMKGVSKVMGLGN